MDKYAAKEGETVQCSKLKQIHELYHSMDTLLSAYKNFKKSKRTAKEKIHKALNDSLSEIVVTSDNLDSLNPFPLNIDFVNDKTIKEVEIKVLSHFEARYKSSFLEFIDVVDRTKNSFKDFNGLCESCDLRIACDLKNYEGV